MPSQVSPQVVTTKVARPLACASRDLLELSPVIPAAVTHVITCHQFTVQVGQVYEFNTYSSGC
jgi:hypothetical protein